MTAEQEPVSLGDATECPYCEKSLLGKEIPHEVRHMYGDKTHYMRTISIEYAYDSPEHYDGVSEWKCPHCRTREGRWTHKVLKDGEVEPRYGESKWNVEHK